MEYADIEIGSYSGNEGEFSEMEAPLGNYRDIVEVTVKIRAKKIQKAIRDFLRKKHENLVVPANFKCPITLELFKHPVVAADGNTYEYTAILHIIHGTMKSPITGQRLTDKNLVPNLNLRSEVMEFRQHNKLNIITNFRMIQPVAALASHPQAPRALASYTPAFLIPYATLFYKLFTIDGFLNEIRKPGLSMLLLKFNNCSRADMFSKYNKEELIFVILNRVSDGRYVPRVVDELELKEIVTKLLDDGNGILPHVTNTALDLVLRSLNTWSYGSNNVHKVKNVKDNLPITLGINMDGDQRPLTVTRDDDRAGLRDGELREVQHQAWRQLHLEVPHRQRLHPPSDARLRHQALRHHQHDTSASCDSATHYV